MYTTPSQRKKLIYLHWETWAGMVLLGSCVAAGSLLGGEYLGHSTLGAVVGCLIGSYILKAITRYVERRYYPVPA
jgi:hypothetical protein